MPSRSGTLSQPHAAGITMRARTMTPLPKNLAKSNTRCGMRGRQRGDWKASTGKSAPAMEPTRMTNTDAMRRPVLSVAPPPEPQLSGTSSRARRVRTIARRLLATGVGKASTLRGFAGLLYRSCEPHHISPITSAVVGVTGRAVCRAAGCSIFEDRDGV